MDKNKINNKPHIVFLTIDQCRVDRLKTHPIFKELKKYGMFCDQVISYAPYTIASMHAIFSGILGNNNGVNGYYQFENFKKEHLFTLPQYLQKEGYFTIGDFINDMTFPKKGWDYYEIHDEYNDDLEKKHLDILEKNLNKDHSFIYLHYSSIHTEMVKQVFNVFSEDDDNYYGQVVKNQVRYDGFVEKAGNYLSSIWNFIKNKVFNNELMFVVITDHGCGLGERIGEKGYGVYTYDDTLKVFSYLIYPPVFLKDCIYSHQLRTIDIMPTILDVLKIEINENKIPIDGKSFLPLLQTKINDSRISYSETGGLGGPNPSPYEHNIKCVRTEDWKLIYNTSTRKRSLYNLKDDPKELNDVSQKNIEVMIKLWNEMIKFQ